MPKGDHLAGPHFFREKDQRAVRVHDNGVGFLVEAAAIVPSAADTNGDRQHDAKAAPLVHVFAGPDGN